MKVYVVTDGIYSDYHIKAVFTDKEKAERFAFVNVFNDEIEEYELDPEVPDIKPQWEVFIGEDGATEAPWRTQEAYGVRMDASGSRRSIYDCHWHLDEQRVKTPEGKKKVLRVQLAVVVCADSAEGAIKAASERRMQILGYISRWPEVGEITWREATPFGLMTREPIYWKWPDWMWAQRLLEARKTGDSRMNAERAKGCKT